MSTVEILNLEEESLQLQLEEIRIKRELLQIKRNKIEKNIEPVIVEEDEPIVNQDTLLNYTPSAKHYCMTIADVCQDGSVLIYGKNGTKQIAKKYSMRTLKWLKNKLPVLSRRQKTEINFWGNVASEYSKKFTPISKVTIEKLCYLVDSGKADRYFNKWDILKNRMENSRVIQSKLD